MRLTKNQVDRYNAKMGNGWRFDIRWFAENREKLCYMTINAGKDEAGNDLVLKAYLCYMDNYEMRMNAYWRSYRVPTGKHDPTLHLKSHLSSPA